LILYSSMEDLTVMKSVLSGQTCCYEDVITEYCVAMNVTQFGQLKVVLLHLSLETRGKIKKLCLKKAKHSAREMLCLKIEIVAVVNGDTRKRIRFCERLTQPIVVEVSTCNFLTKCRVWTQLLQRPVYTSPRNFLNFSVCFTIRTRVTSLHCWSGFVSLGFLVSRYANRMVLLLFRILVNTCCGSFLSNNRL